MRFRSLIAIPVAVVLAASLIGAPASATPSGLRILAANVMMLPPPLDSYDNAQRAELLADADYLSGSDVVVLSEAFDNGPSEALKNGLSARYPYQTPVLARSDVGWDATLGDYKPFWGEDGGITILSRWPITRRVQYIYQPGCGADFLAQKGFVYVRLDVRGKAVHLVGTHVQADDQFCAGLAGPLGSSAAIREAQFTAIDTFLDSLRIPAREPVFVAGDLNVDRDADEYGVMRAALDTLDSPPVGHPYSWDPSTNKIAAERDPGGERLLLDYVLRRRTNAGPGGWVNQVLPVKSAPWETGGTTYEDYSDHYPVAGCVGVCG